MPTFTVKKDKRYRAIIALGLFESFAGNGLIADKLSDAGFADITVTGDGNTRIAEARWSRDDATGNLPPQVADISEIV
jgi:hypothetical protein